MPNWVMNRLVLKGKEAGRVADEILSKDKDSGKEFINFNNIKKMPDSLNIVCGSCTFAAAEYYLSSINPNNPNVKGEKVSQEEYEKIIKKLNTYGRCREIGGEKEHEIEKSEYEIIGKREGYLNYGKTVVNNLIQYGAPTWYEWNMKHWGVKWNASDSRVQRDINEVTIQFETPWDGVMALMTKVGEKYKDVSLVYDCSEEQVGLYEKKLVMEKGDVVFAKRYKEGSKEATEHYMEMWGLEHEFTYDPKIDNYRPKWLEEEKEEKKTKSKKKEKEVNEQEK